MTLLSEMAGPAVNGRQIEQVPLKMTGPGSTTPTPPAEGISKRKKRKARAVAGRKRSAKAT